MPAFARPRTRRRTTIVMLGAWVISLLVGIANACAASSLGSLHAHGEHQADLAALGHSSHTPTDPGQADGADASRLLNPACQKFCDDEATTVVKHDKALEVAPIASSAIAVVWCLRSSAGSPLQARPGAAPAPEAPLTVRFMRLTI